MTTGRTGLSFWRDSVMVISALTGDCSIGSTFQAIAARKFQDPVICLSETDVGLCTFIK